MPISGEENIEDGRNIPDIVCPCLNPAEEAFESIKTLETYLMDLISQENTNSSVKIRSVLREIDNLKPLNGNGYFELKKETLTSIFSTIVTYLIILLQFRNA